METTYRAEHVGSLLRPPELLDARAAFEAGELQREQLRSLEDEAALAALELQRQAGIEVFTDGEMRRSSWLSHLREALDGIVQVERPPVAMQWQDVPEGMTADDIQLVPLAVAEKVRQKFRLSEVEADFMLAHSPGQFKVTMPSPTMTGNLYQPGITDRVYSNATEMYRDVARLQCEEIESLIDRGVNWIQLDSLRYLALIDENLRGQIAAQGLDPTKTVADTVAIDNEVIRAAKQRDGVTVGVHICRGNNRSAWAASGGYDPVAEQLFGGAEADRFLLEYDSDRAGGFEPLRFVPRGKTVVLGLVSSKTPELESQDDLQRRIEEAAKYVPLENLALSPQCGFASTLKGNLLTMDDERRKLELVAETAAKVWG
jgi:5-methyltetrahydropteroyltriglutamate--homocysteine methyltransferase